MRNNISIVRDADGHKILLIVKKSMQWTLRMVGIGMNRDLLCLFMGKMGRLTDIMFFGCI